MGIVERLALLWSRARHRGQTRFGDGSTPPLKIAFFGPCDGKACSKSTALQRLWQRTPAMRRGELVSIATEGDRTLFFNTGVPFARPAGGEGELELQVYSIGGPAYHRREMSRLVLLGAEAVLFVPAARSSPADSELDDESLELLDELLRDLGPDARSVPRAFVLLDGVERSAAVQLEAGLNDERGWPSFVVNRATGEGIEAALEYAVSAALERRRRAGLSSPWPATP